MSKEFYRELVEDVIDAAVDLGLEYEWTSDDIQRAQDRLNIAAEKLYTALENAPCPPSKAIVPLVKRAKKLSGRANTAARTRS